MIQAGQTVKIKCTGFYHHGIADGLGYVIHNSKRHGKVVRETESSFSEGKDIYASQLSNGSSKYAVEKALGYIGLPYRLFTSNCEHFVRVCHDLKPMTPQIQKYIIAMSGLSIALKSNNKLFQLIGLTSVMSVLLTQSDKTPVFNVLTGIAVVGSASVYLNS